MQLLNKNHLGFAVLLGLLGLLVNLSPIPLFGNQQLIIGNLFFVIVAIFLGPWYALLASLLCATGLHLAWDSWHMYLLFPLEALWLGYARRKEFYTLYADITFWLLLGMPLFYLYANLVFQMPNSYMTFITLKQGINGMLYTAIGAICVTMLPNHLHIQGKLINQKRKSFNAQLTYTFTQVMTLVLLVSALIFNNNSIEQQQKDVKLNLEDSAAHLGKATESFIQGHISAIDNAARWLSLSNYDSAQWQSLLSKLHQSYPFFISMLIADDEALISAASPISRLDKDVVKNKDLSIRDRHYFQEAFYNQLTFISPAFLGRGFGSDPIVAISAPIYSKDNHVTPIGIIEGSLNLNKFASIDERNREYHEQAMVLTDENDLVIYASDSLQLAPLTPLKVATSGQRYRTSLNMINFRKLDSLSPEFAYTKYVLKNGWSLYVVMPFEPLIKQVEQQYLTTFSLLFVAFIITILLIKVISYRLTQPLETIAKKFSQWGMTQHQDEVMSDTIPKEIYALSSSIQKSKQELISYQLELEEKVALRTVELEDANLKLQALAERDELTHLYNRRYVENHFANIHDMCKRSYAALAFCIIDIDHFKKINDTYGHQMGDKALVALAELMQQFFKRDTDIVSRYGGEEFLLVLPQCNALQVEQHLNQFREQVAAYQIEVPGQRAIGMTISIGAVISNAGYMSDIDHWFKMADLNLYEAKENGRNRVVCSLLSADDQFS
ncbi:sensor domain-containing diguanylate cyclase [Shewanella sp. cp20]|uniref:sensor domain-containing diguanylate cyclase n=1 Tax=Shewanella sp. cp20 TaxID=1521167 RepID=UPI0005A1CA8C|nr:diguanylate cyclase [Shewanella sp. cp20]KIO34962.1 deoxyuridine 5'-triphosphate nucleotidohydrolase [Shewanella sp. cp20]